MQGGRWAGDRLTLAALRDPGPLGRLTAGLFYGARTEALWSNGLVSLDCDDQLRVTALTVTNPTGGPLPVRVVGWDEGRTEDPNRSYGGTFAPGATTVPVATASAVAIRVRPTYKGGWSGFNVYVG